MQERAVAVAQRGRDMKRYARLCHSNWEDVRAGVADKPTVSVPQPPPPSSHGAPPTTSPPARRFTAAHCGACLDAIDAAGVSQYTIRAILVHRRDAAARSRSRIEDRSRRGVQTAATISAWSDVEGEDQARAGGV